MPSPGAPIVYCNDLLRRAGHPNLVGRRNVHVFLFRLNFERTQLTLALDCVHLEPQEILVLQNHIELFQKRRERDRRLQSLEERFAAGPLGQLIEVALAVADPERIAADRPTPVANSV